MAPPELSLPEDTVLRVVKPLYGIPESGIHWYLTYLEHHLDRLGMTRATTDPCVLIKKGKKGPSGMIALQVDDSLGFGDEQFLQLEEETSRNFKCKPRCPQKSNRTTFNGICLNLVEQTSRRPLIRSTQSDKIRALTIPDTQKGFARKRASCQYTGVNTRPDVCASVQLIAPGASDSSKDDFALWRRAILRLQSSDNVRLDFVPLDLPSIKLVVITDASFAKTIGLRSQLGFVISMTEIHWKCNLVHYGSSRCRRVTRSVMASEVHALSLGFDHALAIQHLLIEALGRVAPIEACTDSKTVFDLVAKDGRASEKRLLIDIAGLKE